MAHNHLNNQYSRSKKEGSSFKPPEGSSFALTAVALQDHWTRTLSLGTNFGPRKIGLGPAARAKNKPAPRSVIDTGLHRAKKKSAKEETAEKEYVLDEKLPPLTLAQKLGIIHAPKPLLSEQEWGNVKAKSNQREDSGDPCVICKEDFGLQEQVLLSCTHVFHKNCLQAFERFTGKKTCPMCRHEQYQTRVIHEGARMHRHKCAKMIQSLWRGYVVRCWYKKLRETVPPKDPNLRKKFYEDKMSSIVDRMIKSIDVDVGRFLQEIENNVRESRKVFHQWDTAHCIITPQEWDEIQLKAVERGIADCPICLNELYLADSGQDELENCHETTTHTLTESHNRTRKNKDKLLLEKLGHNVLPKITTEAEKVKKKSAKSRNMSSTEVPEKVGCCGTNGKKMRSTALLSCTHVFHATCLQTLEDLAMFDMKNTCPVCRAHYQKKIINY